MWKKKKNKEIVENVVVDEVVEKSPSKKTTFSIKNKTGSYIITPFGSLNPNSSIEVSSKEAVDYFRKNNRVEIS